MMVCDRQSIGDVGHWIPHGYDIYAIGLQVRWGEKADAQLMVRSPY
jgi:hypothetical protein